jgi:hypothetical protein
MNYNFDKLFDQKDELGCLGIILMVILVLALAFGISCLYAWIGMLLWNWVIVGELGLFATEMGFWSMWGLIELCGLLFKTHNINNSNN